MHIVLELHYLTHLLTITWLYTISNHTYHILRTYFILSYPSIILASDLAVTSFSPFYAWVSCHTAMGTYLIYIIPLFFTYIPTYFHIQCLTSTGTTSVLELVLGRYLYSFVSSVLAWGILSYVSAYHCLSVLCVSACLYLITLNSWSDMTEIVEDEKICISLDIIVVTLIPPDMRSSFVEGV